VKDMEKTSPFMPFGDPTGKDGNSAGRDMELPYPTDSDANKNSAKEEMEQAAANANQAGDSDRQNRANNPDENADRNNGSGQQNWANDQGQASASSSKGGQKSLGQKLMDALKDFMQNASGEESAQSENQNNAQAQGAPTPSAGQGDKTPDQNGQAGSQSNGNQKSNPQTSSQHSGAGNGTQPQSDKPAEQAATPKASLVTERVPLDASDYRLQTHARAMAGPGTAQVKTQNLSATGHATTNGAEQEDIPLKYRQYVQKYFDHAGK